MMVGLNHLGGPFVEYTSTRDPPKQQLYKNKSLLRLFNLILMSIYRNFFFVGMLLKLFFIFFQTGVDSRYEY